MDEEKKEVVYKENNFWKWLSIGLILAIIVFGFNMCNPFNKTFNDVKIPRYDREANEFDFKGGKEDIQGGNGQDKNIEPYIYAYPSNKYRVGYHVTLRELSQRWHIPIREISKENPSLPTSPEKPIKPGTEVDVPTNDKPTQYEQEVLNLTNKARANQGLKALTIDKTLNACATSKARDMADKNYFDHNSPTYGSPFDMMKQFGITYNSAAENIARGQKTPQEVVDSWMNSPGHRQNIMGNFTNIGIGYDAKGDYWVQQFISK